MSSSKDLSAASGATYGSNSNGTTYTVGSGTGITYTGGSGHGPATTANPYGFINPNDIKAVGGSNLAFHNAGHSIMKWGSMTNGDIELTFFELENGVGILATLDAESSISAGDSLKITVLIQSITALVSASASMENCKPISYIRKHGLERHFRFSTK